MLATESLTSSISESLNLLFSELAKVTDGDIADFATVLPDIRPGEVTIGQMSDTQKRLVVLRAKCQGYYFLNIGPKPADALRWRDLRDLSEALLWSEIHAQTQDYAHDLGIRHGWQIVRMPEDN